MQINFHPLWFTAWDTQNYLLDSVSHFPIIILIIMHVLSIRYEQCTHDFDYIG